MRIMGLPALTLLIDVVSRVTSHEQIGRLAVDVDIHGYCAVAFAN